VNIILQRLIAEREQAIVTMDRIIAQVGEDRDLVDAERDLLEATRLRVAEIDRQIEPLAAHEALREMDESTRAALPHGPPALPAEPRRIDAPERGCSYRSAGAFLVDYLRAQGFMDQGRNRDEAALARVSAAYQMRADQTTADTPGLLPEPIIGGVVNMIDANRPLVTSLGGARPLGNIPGTTFSRPIITQHVQVGRQPGEKQALPSRKMSIQQIPFVKETHGGSVDISRQDIDWTSPAAWDILVQDLADVYSVETETVVATKFRTGATGTPVDVGTAGSEPTLGEWTRALYTAAMRSYKAGQRMPDRIWCSLDVWAALGSLVDVQRVVLPPDGNNDTAAGSATLASFRGDVLGLPRVVVPMFADGTCIIGPSNLFEVYEDVIGLLSVIEPSILGVEVAYGGYLAYGHTGPAAFVPLNMVGVMPAVGDEPAKAGNGGK
jgi:hypothetical protein